MANRADSMVANYLLSFMQGMRACHKNQLCQSPAAALLEFLVMDMSGPFPKTKRGNQHVIVLIDPYEKLSSARMVATVTLTSVPNVFVENWVIPYDIQTQLLTKNRLK